MTASMDPGRAWSGPFRNWREASAHATDAQFAWSDPAWMKRQAEFLESARADASAPPRPSSLPLLAGLLQANRIVDYGGGSGWAFELLNSACPGLNVTAFTVLELSDVVEAHRSAPPADSRLDYVPFEDVGRVHAADLLYANASLHYGESENAFLDAAMALGPAPHLLLDGYLAHPDQEFFLVQEVYGHAVPVRVPQLAHSLQDLRDRGYRITSCSPMLGPVSGDYRYDLPLGHLGESYAKTRRYCIVAQREDAPIP
jgi:putative methyltransferase (TIGR04325 family)